LKALAKPEGALLAEALWADEGEVDFETPMNSIWIWFAPAPEKDLATARTLTALRRSCAGARPLGPSMPESASQEVLRPRKATWALVLLISAAFVAIGVLVLRDPKVAADRAWAYGGVIFFGLCTLVSLLQFLPGSSFLLLAPEGLRVRTMWRTTSYRWADIERFGVAEFTTSHGPFRQRHRLIGFDYVASYPRGRGTQALMNLNRNLTGFEAALPDNYGRSHSELAAYLNTLRARYTASS
jgi:hypothetical protein